MLGFLSSNASKVYYFFGTLWNKTVYIVETLYYDIQGFFVFTLPFQVAPLFPYSMRLISYATGLHNTLSTFVSVYYSRITSFFGIYFSPIIYIVQNMYSKLQYITGQMYSQLNNLSFNLYPKLVSLTGNLYNVILRLQQLNYNALMSYVTTWYSRANHLFGSLYQSVIHVTSSYFTGNVNQLISFIPQIALLIKLPFNNLRNIALNSYSQVIHTSSVLFAHATLLATTGVSMIYNLYPFIPALLNMVTGTYSAALNALVADYTQGFPLINSSVKKTIEKWLEDKILDLIENAIDRFW